MSRGGDWGASHFGASAPVPDPLDDELASGGATTEGWTPASMAWYVLTGGIGRRDEGLEDTEEDDGND